MRAIDRFVPHHAVGPALGILVVGNLVDALATLLWVQLDLADESNPIMASALEQGVGPFLAVKVALVGLAAALLFRQQAQPMTRALLVAPAVLYAYVLGGHAGFAVVQVVCGAGGTVLWG